jgi:hypothetical protein
MDVVFLAFANNSKSPLITLSQEDKAIYNILSPRFIKQHYLIHRGSYATKESIVHNLDQYKNHIRVFLYSGHAGRDGLLTDDGDAHASGIAELLSHCPKLQLVFLNGCSTRGQVEALLEKGIPAVIATSAPVDDQKAAKFSTQFFQSLNNQDSLQAAFDAAKGVILTDDPNVRFSSKGGTIRLSELKKDDGLWGIYYNDEEAMNWTLPMRTNVSMPADFKENELLLSALVKALSKFKQKAKDILEDEAEGTSVSLKPKLDLIISSFPEVLSNQLKKLLIPSTNSSSDGDFFDKVGKSRLQQLVITHQSLMQLLAFTMLAQLWQRASDDSFKIPPETIETIRKFLKLKREERATYDLSDFIAEIRNVLDQNETPYFISEMKEAAKKLNESDKQRDAIQFLQHLNGKAFSPQLDEDEARQLCVIAEEKLATVLEEIGFLSNYTLASVKSIDVLNYRHYANPKYRHNIVKLVQFGASPPLKESEKLRELLDCNSVLIYKETESGRDFLNLSPFVIDNNSFNPKAEDAQLFFFYRCQPENDIFEFAHAYKPKDPLLPLNEEKYFALIKPQFESFSQTIFKQPLATI